MQLLRDDAWTQGKASNQTNVGVQQHCQSFKSFRTYSVSLLRCLKDLLVPVRTTVVQFAGVAMHSTIVAFELGVSGRGFPCWLMPW